MTGVEHVSFAYTPKRPFVLLALIPPTFESDCVKASCHFQVQDARHARSDASRQATQFLHFTKVADTPLQCDEGQPVCQRCIKSQRLCFGTRTGQACSVIHLENSYASGQKKRPRGPRSNPKVEYTSDLDAGLQRPLNDLKTQALMYYLHYHSQTLKDAPNISRRISDDLLPMWTSKAECPILDLAVSSMALAVFSRTQQHPPAAIEGSLKYNQLLRIAQVTILSLDKGNIETCLLAIFLMSRYEDAVHSPNHLNLRTPFVTTLQSFSHQDGALAILKFWKDRLSQSQPATDVIKHTRRSMIKSALMRNLGLPQWILEGASFGEHGLELDYDGIVIRIANVRRRLSTLLKETTGPQRTSHELTSTVEELSKEAGDIDKALQDWTAHIPSSWFYQRHTLSNIHPWPTRDFYSPVVYSYSSPAYAAVWNQYHATRMLINSTRLRILKVGRLDPDSFACEQRLECLSNIKTMANDLASSVPFCLQRFKITHSPNSSCQQNVITVNTNEDIEPYVADLTIWPLTIASSLGDVDVKQTLWFRSELARLGRVVGVRVLECAETDQWLEL